MKFKIIFIYFENFITLSLYLYFSYLVIKFKPNNYLLYF